MTRIGEINGILKPSVPYIEIYGAVNGAITAAWNDLSWSVSEYNTSDFTLRSDGTIFVYTTGIYRIDFELGLKLPNQLTDAIIELKILNNGVAITGSHSILKLLNAAGETDNYGQLNVSKTVYLKTNDLISFQFNTTNNTILIADVPASNYYYSRARISYVPFGGWNNDSGGNIVNRGIRR